LILICNLVYQNINFIIKNMKKPIVTIILILFASFISFFVSAQYAVMNGIEGRWDLTITKSDITSPSWLEVNHSGIKTLTGQFVGDGGSARPISKINFINNKMSFSIPPQWDNAEKDLVVEGVLTNDKLTGTMNTPTGEILSWTAVRAPKLWREKQPIWGKPIALFNGKNLDGWEAFGAENQWIVEKGILTSPKSGANLKTIKTFNDFKLHVEFRYPKESNSGVYLRGRYEVQISDSKGKEPLKGELGAIYGFISPLEMVAKNPGEWQTYDITLIGRLVTVVANGKTIIYKNEIPGITGGALDSNENEPGPIYFQGDHGPVEYRNIVITPAK
jgi:hypothetical protein